MRALFGVTLRTGMASSAGEGLLLSAWKGRNCCVRLSFSLSLRASVSAPGLKAAPAGRKLRPFYSSSATACCPSASRYINTRLLIAVKPAHVCPSEELQKCWEAGSQRPAAAAAAARGKRRGRWSPAGGSVRRAAQDHDICCAFILQYVDNMLQLFLRNLEVKCSDLFSPFLS